MNFKYFFKKLFQPYRAIKLLQNKIILMTQMHNALHKAMSEISREHTNKLYVSYQIISEQELEINKLKKDLEIAKNRDVRLDYINDEWLGRNQNKVRKVEFQ